MAHIKEQNSPRGDMFPADIMEMELRGNITQNLYAHDTDVMKKETARIFGDVVGK